MSDELNTSRSLESLRKEAKRWFKALQGNSQSARDRFERVVGSVPSSPTLRDVQHALAREAGAAGWSELKTALTSKVVHSPPGDQLANWFLANACPDHHVRSASDHIRAKATAMRILTQHPELPEHDLRTAIVCGNESYVERALALNPRAASIRTGASSDPQTGSGSANDWLLDFGEKGWEPLLYLCFTRLDLAQANDSAVRIAASLLERGADANAFFMAGGSRYTPLVGVVGGGEESRPPHPQHVPLIRLLLEYGADPFDMQVFYNLHLTRNPLWYLRLIHEYTVSAGKSDVWNDPEWMMIDEGGYGLGARFLMNVAIDNNDLPLAEWMLAHGASANPAPARGRKGSLPSQETVYEKAVRGGAHDIAELLVRYGAERRAVAVGGLESFTTAALRMDEPLLRTLAGEHPEYLLSTHALFSAARFNRADAVRLLLDIGTSPDVEAPNGARALHAAAYRGALDVARLLIARGAAIDPVNRDYGSTPLGVAVYARHGEMIELLSRTSRDIRELVFSGRIDRVRELLREDSATACLNAGGTTLLMWLPTDDEDNAIALATLLMVSGADASLANTEGRTAADIADRLGMMKLASVLRGEQAAESRPSVGRYQEMAEALLDAYQTGTPEAMRRHWSMTWHQRTWSAMRSYVLVDLGKPASEAGADVDITIDDARVLVARENGYESWDALVQVVNDTPASVVLLEKPIRVTRDGIRGRAKTLSASREWNTILEAIGETSENVAIHAFGTMTDAMLRDIAGFENIVRLKVTQSPGISDDGLRVLSRMPQLKELDLGGTPVTDRGLEILRDLPLLESLMLSMTYVTDAGVARLAACERLIDVNLMWTDTGDGAIRALAGKQALRKLWTGNGVTNHGLSLLHELPVFRTWHGGEALLGLLSRNDQPNHLSLRGSFDDAGMEHLRELDGLFGLDIGDANLNVTPAGLAPLASLPHFQWLSVEADDDTMRYVSAFPHLRYLSCQDATAGDAGFISLGKSQSIEYIWGRRCHGLQREGFLALSRMPALRGLSVSCKNVDDTGLAALPAFPALRELMPMDIPDEGYRHIAQCRELEALLLMYCRETSDAATEHIAGLRTLSRYFASYTQITDRTPRLLSNIDSLEDITFDGCAGLTNSGIAALARLPGLRELRVSGGSITHQVRLAFSESVEVHYSL